VVVADMEGAAAAVDMAVAVAAEVVLVAEEEALVAAADAQQELPVLQMPVGQQAQAEQLALHARAMLLEQVAQIAQVPHEAIEMHQTEVAEEIVAIGIMVDVVTGAAVADGAAAGIGADLAHGHIPISC
jgi:hypothetical protein